jgi:hypothetical protein
MTSKEIEAEKRGLSGSQLDAATFPTTQPIARTSP